MTREPEGRGPDAEKVSPQDPVPTKRTGGACLPIRRARNQPEYWHCIDALKASALDSRLIVRSKAEVWTRLESILRSIRH